MAEIKIEDIKKLKELSGVGLTDAKVALVEAKGDFDKALEAMRKKGLTKAEKRGDRETREGRIDSYVHDGRIGALIEVNCETSFVAKTDEFKDLAHKLAMQVASMDPKDMDDLLAQQYILDASKTVEMFVKDAIAKTGENITIKQFRRIELGVVV